MLLWTSIADDTANDTELRSIVKEAACTGVHLKRASFLGRSADARFLCIRHMLGNYAHNRTEHLSLSQNYHTLQSHS